MHRLTLQPVRDNGTPGASIGSATLAGDGTITYTGSPVIEQLVTAIVQRFRCDEGAAFRRLVADGWSNGKLVVAAGEEGAMNARVDLSRLHNLAETMRAKMPPAVATAPPRGGRSWYRIENRAAAAEAPATADVFLYDMIGDWGISAQDFVNDLRGITASTIDLHVNCEGGEVFDGLAIYETLRRHPAAVTAYVDGIAASSASFVVQAASKVIMAPRGRMMIHDAHGVVMGNARDMREMGQLLDDISDTIADIYAEHSGGTRESWRAAMRAAEGGPDGTWYDASAAVRAGLADEVQGGAPAAVAPHADVVAPVAVDWGVAITGAWDSGAFLSALDEISNPVEPVKIPDGRALRALFDLQ